MNPFLCHICAGLLSLSGLAVSDTTKLLAPSAYQQIDAGTQYTQVEDLLGSSDHGAVTLMLSCTFGEGLAGVRFWTEVEASWETAYGTVTVKTVNGEVTEKSFRPNSEGIKAVLCQLPTLINLRTALPQLRFKSLPVDR
jgi:hypothetical protein